MSDDEAGISSAKAEENFKTTVRGVSRDLYNKVEKELFMNRIIYDEKNGGFKHYTDEEVTI